MESFETCEFDFAKDLDRRSALFTDELFLFDFFWLDLMLANTSENCSEMMSFTGEAAFSFAPVREILLDILEPTSVGSRLKLAKALKFLDVSDFLL